MEDLDCPVVDNAYFKKLIMMSLLSRKYYVILLIASLVLFNACKKDQSTNFGIFSLQDETTAIMSGDINSKTPKHWDNFIKANAKINRIIMKICPGSADDEANLEVARAVRSQDVSIHLPADAEIASGAVDFFLAGTTRTREAGSKIGVHSWSDGRKDATDFPVGHENHLPYIDYYKEMGFTQEDADAFYYFTINAAPAADIHWMTDTEIEKFKLLTQ